MASQPATNATPTSATSRPATEGNAKAAGTPDAPRDVTRELAETVVFVIVLVLMLKLFVAEAFVIPTGSMAPTLWGDQVRCTCRECGHKFPINASDGGRRIDVSSYVCENCGFFYAERDVRNDLSSVDSGDRVLVTKYEYHLRDPNRFDVPVFKYPVEPYSPNEMQSMNYIKRLVGLGGETIGVFSGDLYQTRKLTYDHIPQELRPTNALDAWQFKYMYGKDPIAKLHFMNGNFEIIRKNPEEIRSVRRIVFDLDQQPKSRSGVRQTRWHAIPNQDAGWNMETAGFKHSGDTLGWMRYQHIDPWDDHAIVPYYIVDSIGYNTRDNNRPFVRDPRDHWVADLIVDLTVDISSPDAEIILELAKGEDRFQAFFTKGECIISRLFLAESEIAIDPMGAAISPKEERKEMGRHATKMTKPGKYQLSFANVDSRLTVWIDGKPLAFSKDQSDYEPPNPTKRFEPVERNDLLQPVRVGARGDVRCSKVRLWRDLHYTCAWDRIAEKRKPLEPDPQDYPSCDLVQTFYVQPGHYLMFGDNSNSSADSRSWGLVPKRLLLGRAVMVYYPFRRLGVIE